MCCRSDGGTSITGGYRRYRFDSSLFWDVEDLAGTVMGALDSSLGDFSFSLSFVFQAMDQLSKSGKR